MGNWEIGELINLCIDAALLPILVFVLVKGKNVPQAGLILVSTLFIVLSHIATLAEGFFLPRVFDTIEHAGILAAGIGYSLAFLRSSRGKGAYRP